MSETDPSGAFRNAKTRSGDASEPSKMSTSAGRAKACTSCRQVKLKCDAAETFPASCTRCTTKNMECRMDSNFKRIPTRHKLKEVTSELTSLKEAIKTRPPPASQQRQQYGRGDSFGSTSQSNVSSQSFSFPGFDQSDPLLGSHSGQSISSFYGIRDQQRAAYEVGEHTIGDTTLSGQSIVSLFQHFEKKYYHHGIVLDITWTLPELFEEAPLLFWTVIITSARHHPQHTSIYEDLTSDYESFLLPYLVRPMHALSTIHAILIICTWPLPVQKQPDDPSWNYCGLITNAAVNIGLHQPGREREYGFPRATPQDVSLRSRTFLYVFRLNILFVTRMGVPGSLIDEASLREITRICKATVLEDEIYVQVEISRCLARYTYNLQLHDTNTMLESLIRLGCNELDAIQSASRTKWSAETTLQFLAAKLFLYGWAFHGKRSESDETHPVLEASSQLSPTQRIMLHENFHAATQYIQIFAEIPNEAFYDESLYNQTTSIESPPSQAYLPKHYHYTLYFCALVLYEFLSRTSLSGSGASDQARNNIQTVHTQLSRCAFANSTSYCGRLAGNIEIMGEFLRKGYIMPKEHAVESRMGAGAFYDAMLKIAVLKAAKGEVSAAEDLMRHEENKKAGATPAAEQVAQNELVGLGEMGGQQQATGGAGFGEEFVPQEWDQGIWGWDISMLDSMDLHLDWNTFGES